MRPTYPNFLGDVTGNTHIFSFGLIFIFRSLSPQLRFILGYTEVEILCALRLDAVVLRTVEVRDFPGELAGRQVLINMAVPCILKAQFQLCDNG